MGRSRKLVVIDAETDPFDGVNIPAPFLWGLYDGESFQKYDTLNELLAEILDQRYVVYAHNGGKFDYHLGFLERLEPYAEILNIHGRLARFRLGDCEFRDSYNLFPMGLASYKKEKIDYSIFERGKRDIPLNRKLIEEYLEADCRYLYELVEGFHQRYGSHLTLATAAIKQLAKLQGIRLPKSSRGFYETFSAYYHGGRCECLKRGVFKGPIYDYDIHSAYPWAMLDEHPWGFGTDISGAPRVWRSIQNQDFVSLRCVSKGALPIRMDAGLAFPSDDTVRLFHVTGWEFREAMRLGLLAKVQIEAVVRFAQRQSFEKHVAHFYKMKADSPKGSLDYLFPKLMLNAPYGKFGANPAEYNVSRIFPEESIDAGRDQFGLHFAGRMGPWALMEAPLPDEQQHFYNVATAASITGKVRARWMEVRLSEPNIITLDTDGFTCLGPAKSLKLGDKIGEWGLDAVYDRDGASAGKKLYCWRRADGTYKLASKGVRCTPETIFEIAMDLGKKVSVPAKAPTFSLHHPPRYVARKIRATV